MILIAPKLFAWLLSAINFESGNFTSSKKNKSKYHFLFETVTLKQEKFGILL